MEKFLKKLRKCLEGTQEEEKAIVQIKKVSRKEKMESVFQMVYYGEFINKDEGQIVKRLFDNEND